MNLVPNRAADVPAVADRLAEYQRDAEGAFSENTQRAIKADTSTFAEWCGRHGYTSLPADAATVKAFLRDMADQRAPATLRRYLSSIAHLHRAAELPDPTKTQKVRLAMKAIARERGTRQRQAHGLTMGLVDRLLDAAPDTLRGKRDAALLAVAYSTLARRSELVALNVKDVEFAEDGSGTVLIRRSKADQEGQGSVRYVDPKAVRTVAEWLSAAGIEAGPLFRSTPKGGKVGGRLHGSDVPRAFKRLALAANVKVELVQGISGHSTRVGAAQDLVGDGANLPEVMQVGGWRSSQMVARYTEHQAAHNSAMARMMARKGRN
jgi:integrase